MQGFISTTSMQCLVALFYFLLLVENTSSSGFSKEGTLPQMVLAQAAVERCGPSQAGTAPQTSIDYRAPSSFALRVGDACVLVTVLNKEPLQIASSRPSMSSLSILRTPELFCSLVGRPADCLAIKRVISEIDEGHIASTGSHISAAGLSMSLADDCQDRSLYTGTRPLAYNALIIGKGTGKEKGLGSGKGITINNYVKKKIEEENEKNNSLINSGDASDRLITTATVVTSGESDKSLSTPTDPLLEDSDKQEQDITQQQREQQQQRERTLDLFGRKPSCRVYKVDLTGNFYRCQAAAAGGMALKVETWMRSKGSYFAHTGGRNKSEGKGEVEVEVEGFQTKDTGTSGSPRQNGIVFVEGQSTSGSGSQHSKSSYDGSNYTDDNGRGCINDTSISGSDIDDIGINGTAQSSRKKVGEKRVKVVDNITNGNDMQSLEKMGSGGIEKFKVDGADIIEENEEEEQKGRGIIDEKEEEERELIDAKEVEEQKGRGLIDENEVEEQKGRELIEENEEEEQKGRGLIDKKKVEVEVDAEKEVKNIQILQESEEVLRKSLEIGKESNRGVEKIVEQTTGHEIQEIMLQSDEPTDTDSDSDSESNMHKCLHMAQCCLEEVYGTSSLSSVTIQIATIQGDSLWGPGHLVFEDLLASQIDTPVTIPIPVPTAGSVSTDIGLTMVNSQNIPFDRIESSSSNSSSTNGDCISVSASCKKDALHDWWMKLQASTIDL